MSKKLLCFALLLPALLLSQSDDSWIVYDDAGLARIDITIAPAALDWILTHAESDSEHYARFHFQNRYIDESVDSVGFRVRGNTSREAAKKSFKVSFNTFVRGREFHGLDKLNLNGEHNDPSIIRSKLCFDLYRDIGRAASRASHVRLYINGRYHGLYISVEHMDDEFISKHFADDSGNLWKCLYPADLRYRGEDPLTYRNLESGGRPAYELTTNEESGDFSALVRFIRVLNMTPAAALPDSLEDLLDVPGVLQYLAINVLVGSWDDYRALMNNYYLYCEPASGRFTLIPYDYDNTFGIDWFGTDWSQADPYTFPKVADGARPLAERLLVVPAWRDLYSHFLDFYLNSVFRLPRWEERIDRLKTLITPAAEADSFRTRDYGFDMADFNGSYSAGDYQNQHVKFGLKQFINRRSASLPGQLRSHRAAPTVYRIDLDPPHPAAGDSIHVAAACFAGAGLQRVTLLFTPAGASSATALPMQRRPVPGTKKVEEADRWLGVLPPLPAGADGTLRIEAVDSLDQARIFPLRKALAVKTTGGHNSTLRLNELMADNSTAAADEAGDHDDWLEIFNSGSEPAALAGLYLTDKRDRLNKWRIAQTIPELAPGTWLVIWCDEEQEQGSLHANFKLSAGGEFLALVDRDGLTILDSLSFGPQTTNLSLGRYPDGHGAWQTMAPTPGTANRTANLVQQRAQEREFTLQAWPNPFNASAQLHFGLPRSGRVTLRLYNAMGQRVKTLLDGELESGNHALLVNADDLPSGILFCRLKADGVNKTIKLVVVK
ncbi:MAG TPA: CotH kinase family protein [bacterium]|nr:CotH kinase family protein [bacterium]